MTGVQFTGIHHVVLVTGDMDKTVRFWRDVLGMPLVAAMGNRPDHYPHRHYFFQVSLGCTVAFFEWQGLVTEYTKPAGLPARGQLQFDHLSFGVADREDLLRLKDRLEKAGVEVSEVVDHRILQSIYFHDPNGIALEASCWTRPIFGDELDAEAFEDPEPVEALRPSRLKN